MIYAYVPGMGVMAPLSPSATLADVQQWYPDAVEIPAPPTDAHTWDPDGGVWVAPPPDDPEDEEPPA